MYEDTFARNSRCSKRRRIDEVNIISPVAVDQRAFNFLEEDARLFDAMRILEACRLQTLSPDNRSYGAEAMSDSKTRKWVRKFKDERTNVHDE
ncbi:hypothetical protein TNCV_2844141 [Trichonephila clavipes]|nr:hypothetical protein TNCV_2844141 [Trichonephila clavipes]